MTNNLATAFEDICARRADATGLFYGEAEFSYADLLSRARWVADRLRRDLGVKPGDRVGLWLRNCPEFVPALFGALMAGAVVVPINNFLKPQEVDYIAGDCGITVLVTDASLTEARAGLEGIRPGLRFLAVEEMGGLTGPGEPCRRAESDLAVIIYTSGTTGHPKGAMLSHGNLLHNVNSCRQMLEAVGDDRFVVLLPMFHSFMLCVGIFLPVLVGGSIVLVKSVHPAKNVIQEIMHRRATILPSIPQFFRGLAHPSIPRELPLRLCISGGAPLPAEILNEFGRKFSIPLIEGYGLSEASPVVSFNPLHGDRKPGSIGMPIPDVEMSVQGDTGEMLGAGQTGEICVRGGNVMQGYWKKPEETALAMRGGWLLTGDIGHRDADGYYFITDRKKDMLLVNGINVYPREIEEVLYQIPEVREAAVIGRPDARKGEHAVAYVALHEGAVMEEKAVQQFVRDRLADYKVPRQVHFLPNLPRTATGKVLKTALRTLAQQSPVAGDP